MTEQNNPAGPVAPASDDSAASLSPSVGDGLGVETTGDPDQETPAVVTSPAIDPETGTAGEPDEPQPGNNPEPIKSQSAPAEAEQASALVDPEAAGERDEPVGLDYRGTDEAEPVEYVAGEREPNGVPTLDPDEEPSVEDAARQLVDEWDGATTDERNVLMARVRRALGDDDEEEL